MLAGLGHLRHNFEIRGAGWPREETTRHQQVRLFRRHRYCYQYQYEQATLCIVLVIADAVL